MDNDELKERVIGALKNVVDPEVGKSVYDINLIRELHVEDGNVRFTFMPSSFLCPIAMPLALQI